MTEGQTRRMQQVAANSSWTEADRVASPAEPFWPQRFTPAAKPNGQRDQIRRVVQTDVLPRLSMGHVQPSTSESVDPATVCELVELLLRPGHELSVSRYVEGVLGRDLPVEHIYLRLFQPAARRLGDLWLEDLCSFVDVTLGMGTLQALLRRLAPGLDRHVRPADGTRSILLTTLPGDQHTFGINMAAEFFRRSGWDVATCLWREAGELADAARAGGSTIVGFSASGERRLDELSSAVTGLRKACGKKTLGILVGGPVFVANPEQAIRVGADAVGLDARQAVAQAEALASRTEPR